MTIDEAMQEAVRNGLRGFTLWPSHGRWQANVTYDGTGWRCETRDTADEAIRAVLGASAVSKIETDETDIFG
ncbi:MAG: hypothetical protein ACOVN5_07015 [Aquidulcibacter sp.]